MQSRRQTPDDEYLFGLHHSAGQWTAGDKSWSIIWIKWDEAAIEKAEPGPIPDSGTSEETIQE
jgi:hypothetical protein